MPDLFNKDNYTEIDINDLIAAATEESINLDFKASDGLGNTDGKKSEISKDVSAFANSDGGIIIYGINEQNHTADSISYVDGNVYSKEWLEQVINSRIQERIDGIIIHPIRFGGSIDQTVYLIKIPKSHNAPHMASDKRFYKRFNFQSVQMEQYEVRELYNRTIQSDLVIEDAIIQGGSGAIRNNQLLDAEFTFNFQVKNTSNTIEERYKLEITLPRMPFLRARIDFNPLSKFLVRHEGDFVVFSVPNSSPLFQQELTTIISGNVRIKQDHLHLFQEPGIKTKLYFSNGTKERIFKFGDALQFRGKLLKDWEWAY